MLKVALNAKWYVASWECVLFQRQQWKLPRKETDEYVRAGTMRSRGHDSRVF